MERSWTTVDKSDWGGGAWDDEPDKIQWIDEATGFDCLIHRGPLGALCGYVGVPPEHPAYGSEYDDVRVAGGEWPDVHGGLTYAAGCADTDDESTGICHVSEPGRPHDVWWLGFDCGRSGDFVPGMEAREREMDFPWNLPERSYKNVAYVRAEVTSLAWQLAESDGLPASGGPHDGGKLRGRYAHRVLKDGSVYRYDDGDWVFAGPRAGRCSDCGAEMDPRGAPDPPRDCPLCGGRLVLPR